ncbi:MAG TPA: hypothetical protein DHW02_15970 [Ktedonobacter sp.]|nr:hypothetical protein [Ktedonobacter sp.]
MSLRRIVVVILILLVFAGCDTAQSAKVSVLQVTRPASKYPAFSKTVHDATLVQRFYNLAYSLPSPPAGKVNCPADNGVVYNLTFLDDSTLVQTMVLQASGCERLFITNNSQNMRMPNQAFQAAFLKLIGLPSLIPYPTPGT